MIVVMKSGATKVEIEKVIEQIASVGFKAHPMYGVERTVIGCLGDERGKSNLESLNSMPGVDKVMPILTSYKLAAKQLKEGNTVVDIGNGCKFGQNFFGIIAGPCAVESEEQIVASAKAVKTAGAGALRGGAYKPRSSTYSFQGHGEEGLKMLAVARKETGLPIVTEIMDYHDLDLIERYADVLQIGARNMQNFPLLKAVGTSKKPILLKRGMSATVDELLQSAEYILAAGNPNVILCERGIRTYETATRNTMDLNAIPALQDRSHLPIVVDPSHGTGVRKYVPALARAGIAVGANGLIIEVHPDPTKAISDGAQTLYPAEFEKVMKEVRALAEVLNLTVC